MTHELLWVVVVVVAIAVLLMMALTSFVKSRVKPFHTQMFPANYVEPYERRIDEVERLFVNQPREAVAAAKLLVDDMLTRMGYPVRISNDERVRDLRHYSRTHAERYRLASGLKATPTTEDLRRTLMAYLDTARELCAEARRTHRGRAPEEARRPEIAG